MAFRAFREVGEGRAGSGGALVVVVWVVGFLLFLSLSRQESGLEGALTWGILGGDGW